MSDAIQMRQAHFKGKFPIEAYGGGGFRFAETSHKGALLCAPSGFYSANLVSANIMCEDLQQIIDISSEIEILLIGTGLDIVPINVAAKTLLKKHSISTDIMNTGAAVRTYNILLAEDRAVAALLYPV